MTFLAQNLDCVAVPTTPQAPEDWRTPRRWRAIRESPVNPLASWSAVARHRFGTGLSRWFEAVSKLWAADSPAILNSDHWILHSTITQPNKPTNEGEKS